MCIKIHDRDGNRYTVTFDGQVTREKAIQLFDLIELLGGVPESRSEWVLHSPNLSKFDRVQLIIKTYFPLIWFSSKEIQTMYEQEFKEPITLSTISTYLSRMVNRGILTKDKNQAIHRYRAITEITRLSKFLR